MGRIRRPEGYKLSPFIGEAVYRLAPRRMVLQKFVQVKCTQSCVVARPGQVLDT